MKKNKLLIFAAALALSSQALMSAAVTAAAEDASAAVSEGVTAGLGSKMFQGTELELYNVLKEKISAVAAGETAAAINEDVNSDSHKTGNTQAGSILAVCAAALAGALFSSSALKKSER